MKKRLLVVLVSMPIVAMNQYEARKSGMQTLQAIKTTTVCCIMFCNYVDSCTGRNALEALSKQSEQNYSDSHSIANRSDWISCLTGYCLQSATSKKFGYSSQNNNQ